MMKQLSAWLIALVVLGAPLPGTAAPSIGDVDFGNLLYPHTPCGPNVQMKHGTHVTLPAPEDPAKTTWRVHPPVLGHLNNQIAEVAAVAIECGEYGATGIFSEAYLFGMRAGRPTELAVIKGGDRSWGGLLTLAFHAGRLEIERCLPADLCGYAETTTYAWDGHRLIALKVSRHVHSKGP